MIARFASAVLLAAGVTFGLFLLMKTLITMHDAELQEKGRQRVIEFVRLKREKHLELKKRELPKRTDPEAAPPPPDLRMSKAPPPAQNAASLAIGLTTPETELSVGAGGGGLPSGDSDVIPLVRVSPQYPVAASQRRLEGWVLVEFTITAAGTVKDPVAVRAEPPGIFEGAALQAVRRWKYKPGVKDGVPFERPGVRVKMDFRLRNKET